MGRSPPHFRQRKRHEERAGFEPAPRSAREPLMKPRDQPGVLWDHFRGA